MGLRAGNLRQVTRVAVPLMAVLATGLTTTTAAAQTSPTTPRSVPQAIPTHSYGFEWILFLIVAVVMATILIVVRTRRSGRQG